MISKETFIEQIRLNPILLSFNKSHNRMQASSLRYKICDTIYQETNCKLKIGYEGTIDEDTILAIGISIIHNDVENTPALYCYYREDSPGIKLIADEMYMTKKIENLKTYAVDDDNIEESILEILYEVIKDMVTVELI